MFVTQPFMDELWHGSKLESGLNCGPAQLLNQIGLGQNTFNGCNEEYKPP